MNRTSPWTRVRARNWRPSACARRAAMLCGPVMSEPMTVDALSALEEHLSEDERMVRDTVRRLIRERYLPRAGALYEKEEFPNDLIGEMAEMGLLGAGLKGYGCAGMSAVQYCLILQELE